MRSYKCQLSFRFIANLKIVHKLLLSYILLILIPLLLISWIFYRNFSSFATEYVTYSTKQVFEQAYSFLSYKLNNVKEVSNILVRNDNIAKIIKTDEYSKDDVHQMESMNELLNFIYMIENKTNVARIRLYVPDSLIYSKDNLNIFNISSAITTKWYKTLVESNKSYLWAPSSYLGPDDPNSEIVQNNKISNKDTLSLTKLLLDPENYNNFIAAVRLDFYKNDVVTILNKANTFSNSLTYIQNSEGEIVATSSNDLLKKYSVKNISFNNSTNNLSNWIDYRFTHENALIGYHVLENTNWCMVTIIPLGNIELESKHMKNLISIFVLVISACSYVIAYIISRSITKGISELANKMHDLHNGRLEPINISSRKDEIGMLIEDYNYMTVRMTELIKEQYRSGQMLKTSELKALQSQINPHFLYNTLDMINWFARSNKGEEITSVVESLSQFYKISLSGGKNIISIKDELEHVSNYFQIQNMRFNNNLKLNISIPEEMLDCGILKITLQPIVENAILHGILCKESKTGTVKISGYQIDGDIIIAIKDDGIGMSECSLNKIIRGEIISQKGSSFGLKNIHERIELHFGIGYGLSFKSNLGRGTTVEIRIAMEKL